jgi:SanA protein
MRKNKSSEQPERKRLFRFSKRLIVVLVAAGALVLVLPRLMTALYAGPRLFSVKEAASKRVAIVFGAGLLPDGSATPALKDRVATAADLYLAGKVDKLLLSGDNRFVYYNEPQAMKDFALSLGVPAEAIVLDYAGRRTYDTCYRARDIFKISEAILITKDYHLPRAIYVCNALGVQAVGVPAQWGFSRPGPRLVYLHLRELVATAAMLWEVYVSHPRPVLGDPEPIFPLAGD